MTLKDLLFTCCSNNEECKYATVLDTMDSSFPKEYRHHAITYAELFVELRRNNKDDLLERSVKSISLQPKLDLTYIDQDLKMLKIDTEEKILESMRYNTKEGFNIEVVYDEDRSRRIYFSTAIKVVLEDEV